ncbi:MAG: hypothetical protein ACTHKK_03520 [Candidatus Nitrosocosmicus sp.]
MPENHENNESMPDSKAKFLDRTNSYKKKFLTLSKKRFVIILAISIFLINFPIIFSEDNNKKIYGDVTNIVTIIPAVILGFILLSRYSRKQIFLDMRKKALLSFTIGLFLWAVAESLWTYYEVGLKIDSPFPSFADALWIVGYILFGYYFFNMSRIFKGKGESNIIIYISVATSLALAYIYNLTFGVAEIVSAQHHILTTIISILYPMLDGALLIPSVFILLNNTNKKPSSLLWILLSVSMIWFIIADTYFGYGVILGIADLIDTSIFYNAGYLSISFGLLWYYTTSTSKKTTNALNSKVEPI